MKIYVASSWRNEHFDGVVKALRRDNHEVYDFKDSLGFNWSEVDPDWKKWPTDVAKYLKGLMHPKAESGFARDMNHLRWADAVVYVTPRGVSASWEAGYSVGVRKLVIVYAPEIREPDLMLKMSHLITDDLRKVRNLLLECDGDRPPGHDVDKYGNSLCNCEICCDFMQRKTGQG